MMSGRAISFLSLSIAILMLCAVRCKADHATLDIKIKTASKEFLLGEPVAVHVQLTNTSALPVNLSGVLERDDRTIQEVQILISHSAEAFEEYRTGLPILIICSSAGEERLQPRQSVNLQARILYASQQPSKLAFPEAGTYGIKIRYRGVESDPVRIVVREPNATEAKVWEVIRKPELLRFLQTGLEWEPERERHGEVVDTAIRLLREHPKSAYADDLRWVLNWYYRETRHEPPSEQSKAGKRMVAIRELLHIKEPKAPVLFEEDLRLTLPVTYQYKELMPLQQVYDDLSAQTGIPFSIHPDLTKRRLLSPVRRTKTLREVMDVEDAYKAKWIKDGNGYMLVPDDPPAE